MVRLLSVLSIIIHYCSPYYSVSGERVPGYPSPHFWIVPSLVVCGERVQVYETFPIPSHSQSKSLIVQVHNCPLSNIAIIFSPLFHISHLPHLSDCCPGIALDISHCSHLSYISPLFLSIPSEVLHCLFPITLLPCYLSSALIPLLISHLS